MRQRRNQRGQELIELGITIVLFVTVALGILMFGYAWMVANMITHAARDGARLAASWASRGACQQITDKQPIIDAVNARIATVTVQTFYVTVDQQPGPITTSQPCSPPPGATPTVSVTVAGCVPYLFNILNLSSDGCQSGFKVNRKVVFVDELRG